MEVSVAISAGTTLSPHPWLGSALRIANTVFDLDTAGAFAGGDRATDQGPLLQNAGAGHSLAVAVGARQYAKRLCLWICKATCVK